MPEDALSAEIDGPGAEAEPVRFGRSGWTRRFRPDQAPHV
jgi:hypothetical protein